MTNLDDESIPSIDPRHFRDVMGTFATGVTIITARDGEELYGMSANSFVSISLDPPLIAFTAAFTSTTYPHIKETGRFCVNVLSDDQEDAARVFSQRGIDRFAHVAWHEGPSGAIILDNSLAWLDCTLHAEVEAGDHQIVLGRVLSLGIDSDAEPLLFFRGRYHLARDEE